MSNEENNAINNSNSKAKFGEISPLVAMEGRQLPISRNGVEFQLEKLKLLRGTDKGRMYYGISLTDASTGEALNDFDNRVTFIGKSIAAAYLETSINTKLQAFNISALQNAKINNKNWRELNEEQRAELFEVELTSIIEQWSMRGETKAKIVDEMKEVGERLKALKPEEKVKGNPTYDELMAEFSMLAMKQIGLSI